MCLTPSSSSRALGAACILAALCGVTALWVARSRRVPNVDIDPLLSAGLTVAGCAANARPATTTASAWQRSDVAEQEAPMLTPAERVKEAQEAIYRAVEEWRAATRVGAFSRQQTDRVYDVQAMLDGAFALAREIRDREWDDLSEFLRGLPEGSDAQEGT